MKPHSADVGQIAQRESWQAAQHPPGNGALFLRVLRQVFVRRFNQFSAALVQPQLDKFIPILIEVFRGFDNGLGAAADFNILQRLRNLHFLGDHALQRTQLGILCVVVEPGFQQSAGGIEIAPAL